MPNYKRSDLKKVDSVTGAVLVGGVFNIYDADENLLLENVTTDANGLIQLEDMEPGTYYWEEVSAPDGYLKAVGKTEFTIEGTGNVIEIPNDPKSKLIKLDMYSKEVLASDGSFNIYDADMNLILQDVTPDADGYIELPGNTLTKGTYYWEENYAADGY
ncbi:MAG: hypothetical protein LUE86_14135, partial [Clostridiales bacterium]|nr:hypothetical protein [Clostridiales bacterium]